MEALFRKPENPMADWVAGCIFATGLPYTTPGPLQSIDTHSSCHYKTASSAVDVPSANLTVSFAGCGFKAAVADALRSGTLIGLMASLKREQREAAMPPVEGATPSPPCGLPLLKGAIGADPENPRIFQRQRTETPMW